MAPIATVVASNCGGFQDTSCYLHPVNRLDRQTSGGFPPDGRREDLGERFGCLVFETLICGLAVFTYTLED